MSAPAAIGWAMMTWSFERDGQTPASFIHTDGVFGGSPAGDDRDGIDLSTALVGTQSSFELSDVEILEAAYPILIEERNTARGDHGLGAFRSGSASHEILRPHGVERLTGTMISTCGSVPNPGMAGGGPGTRSRLRLLRPDGGSEEVPLQAMGVPLAEGDRFELQGPTGGGFGDPLWRPAELVANDVRRGRISAEEAERFYAVDCGDPARTERLRSDRRTDRLAKATPPARPGPAGKPPPADAVPLFPGVVQAGSLAIAEASGAVLAEAPYPWTDGCCTLDEENVGANGYVVRMRSYLDPVSGRRLHHEILQPDGTSLFECSPDRWTGRNSTDV
jgi:N-methylhydantoinase B